MSKVKEIAILGHSDSNASAVRRTLRTERRVSSCRKHKYHAECEQRGSCKTSNEVMFGQRRKI